MKKRNNYFKLGYWIFACAVLLTGCSKEHSTEERIVVEDVKEEMGEEKKERQEMESGNVSLEENTKDTEDDTEDMEVEPEIAHADWSEYFNGLNGTAVIYDASNRRYTIYNDELAETRRSPCSTFKIISSLTALEQGILDPEDSTRTWSGEVFWNEDWNRDIDFSEAFRTSCVWYYRQLIDDIGQDRMQEELEKLQYGNCDISDWEGRLNTNNNNRVLTGFWLESSLLISPKEQTEVMERIFGENSEYSEETQNDLKQVMLVTEQEQTDILLYGKTGMGKAEGIVVDAWFTGFAETAEGNLYFCVRLGRTDGMNVSSPLAKEIAIKLVSYYNR
ncbi:class D beta-lactamase [Petralouisia muris]|uniref:Class D beta-lactamase n=1 Tax=Petralouisia muris TaxID=3032872 RepID=A0AC61RN57_9FIRM|nr:class D beta-lactamase [Petralouisia muris]TGY88042.1 class D beta-lactamase [Petralouisia muris]